MNKSMMKDENDAVSGSGDITNYDVGGIENGKDI